VLDGFLNSPLVLRARRLIAEHAWWVIILGSFAGGLAALALSVYPFSEGGWVTKYVKPDDLRGLLKSVGTAVLSGGVFAAILKALQFSKVFQEELSAVIYEPRFLERRADIEAVWGDVSDILYKRKFPAISDKIKKTILETYFPTKVNYYYDSFYQDVEYKFLDDSPEHMVVTEIINFKVRPVGKTEDVKLNCSSTILKSANDSKTRYELLEVKINGERKTVEYEQENKEEALEASFLLEMRGQRNTKSSSRIGRFYVQM